MATQRSNTPYVASPLAVFADRLFAAGEYTCTGMMSSGLLAWNIPPHLKSDKDLGEWGVRMAAAHVIMLGKLGDSCAPNFLGLIKDEEFLEDLQNNELRGHTAAREYLQQIKTTCGRLGSL